MRPQELLDSPGLEDSDPAGMLRDIASGAAQVREAATLALAAGVGNLAGEDLPRSVVTLGMGGSGIAGDMLAAVAGSSAPVPFLAVKGHTLPAWVGAADLVMAVSCSGTTEETLAAAQEAARRGCRLVLVGANDSPLHQLAARARGLFLPVTQGRQPRASMFALTTPLLLVADALGLLSFSPEEVESTAVHLERLAARYVPATETAMNPAKALAAALSGCVPMAWGASPLTGAVAYRFACQLNENAKRAASWGVLPEAGHNQVIVLDGGLRAGEDDFFRDREDDPDVAPSVHLVLLRDEDEHPRVALRAEVVADIARARGVEVTELLSEGSSVFERLSSLVVAVDWASAYLALLEGTDPSPIRAIDELKGRLG